MAKKKTAKTRQPTFEQSLAELESIVAKLEGGQLGLADSLEQYEQGVKHLKSCYHLLDDAERRIEVVSRLDAAGRPKTEPFDEADDETLDDKGAARTRRRTAKGSRGKVDDGSSLF